MSFYSGNASSPNSGASSSKLTEDVIAVSRDKGLLDAIHDVSRPFRNYLEFSQLYAELSLYSILRINTPISEERKQIALSFLPKTDRGN